MIQNKVRIIGGEWRHRLIPFPPVDDLRPTPDRVRETLFNWLGQRLDGKICLDLFAGSGALGFEARSRGAAQVTLVERDHRTMGALRDNAQMLEMGNLEFAETDAIQFLTHEKRRFDVIFLDPPFHKGILPLLFPLLEKRLNPDGMVYAERGKPLETGESSETRNWRVWREGRAGKVFYYLLTQEGG